MHRALCWLARLTAIAAIGFISLFSLDVFQPGVPLAEALSALAIHLLPSAALVVVLVIAWRRPLIGGIGFLLVAALPFRLLANPLSVNLLLAAPFLVAGLLFLACFLTSRHRAAS
jgi:hypothetical protein